VDSQSMELKLPGEKIRKIRIEARQLLATPSVQAQSLAQFLGKLNATSPALQMAPLFCHSLQISLRHSLDGQLPGLSVSGQAISSGSGRPAMVGTTLHLLEWEKPNFPSLNNSNRLRCFTAGLGSHLRGDIDPQEQKLP